MLLGTVCVVWMGVKLGCRVNSSLVRFGTWLLTGTIGELEKRSVAPPLLLALPTDWVLGDTLGV